MADLLAELEGFLGADAVAQLRAKPGVEERLSRASELIGYYDGETDTPPAPPKKREDPPIHRAATGATDETLAQIMSRLDSFGDIKKTITDEVNAVVQTRGNELANNAIAISMRNMRELTKIDSKHRAEFGEELDDTKLSAHIDAAITAGRPFRTTTDAYEDMTREARIAKQIKEGVTTGVREELKTRASGQVPGVSSPAATPMLKVLKASRPGSTTESGTHLDKAARALEERLAERGEHVA